MMFRFWTSTNLYSQQQTEEG
ncbi:unnamed protein product [Victoria cruziana]